MPQGRAHSRTVALGATLLVHLALGVGLWRLTADALHPGQSAPVSHGAPAALFRGINVLNTEAEGGN